MDFRTSACPRVRSAVHRRQHACVVARAHACDKTPVFQADRRFEPVTMLDIEDLLEASINMRPLEKRDYFYSNGVDYENVVRYYGKVQRLNAAYNNDNEPHWFVKWFFQQKNM